MTHQQAHHTAYQLTEDQIHHRTSEVLNAIEELTPTELRTVVAVLTKEFAAAVTALTPNPRQALDNARIAVTATAN